MCPRERTLAILPAGVLRPLEPLAGMQLKIITNRPGNNPVPLEKEKDGRAKFLVKNFQEGKKESGKCRNNDCTLQGQRTTISAAGEISPVGIIYLIVIIIILL
jgi:hypothetical protein